MTSKIIKDADLIETARRQIESIAVLAEQLRREGAYGEEMGKRLYAYANGLRNTINLLEARIVRAR